MDFYRLCLLVDLYLDHACDAHLYQKVDGLLTGALNGGLDCTEGGLLRAMEKGTLRPWNRVKMVSCLSFFDFCYDKFCMDC
jgi:hypothetical protein